MNSSPDSEIAQLVEQLREKYDRAGQDLSSYLKGLLCSKYTTHWEYIHLDTLLSLQKPKTNLPDERIFIVYHQITELYFSLILHELDGIVADTQLTEDTFLMRLDRITGYFTHLKDSFSIMREGMNREHFLKFRMALLPASGFQSVQYRLIELRSTDIDKLVFSDYRSQTMNKGVKTCFEHLYWKHGAKTLGSDKKMMMLTQFEEHYGEKLMATAIESKENNLRSIYLTQFPDSKAVHKKLKKYDQMANISWRLAHLRSTAYHLRNQQTYTKATGGTNWKTYLSLKAQKIIFFPELWSENEWEKLV